MARHRDATAAASAVGLDAEVNVSLWPSTHADQLFLTNCGLWWTQPTKQIKTALRPNSRGELKVRHG